MTDLELALWSLSAEERDMLKRYALCYCCEYGNNHAQLERVYSYDSEMKLELNSSYAHLPQTEQTVIFSKEVETLAS